jgi:hypothetical protein
MTGSFEGCKAAVVGGSSGTGKGTAQGVPRPVLHPHSPKSLLEERRALRPAITRSCTLSNSMSGQSWL